MLQDERLTPQKKSLLLIVAGLVLIGAGYLWALQFPIIKAIWTSSFVLVAAGWSAIVLGVLHQTVDVWGLNRWPTVFVWIGANAILLYFLNNLMSFERFAVRFVGGDVSAWLDQAVTPGTGRLAAHILGLVFVAALAGYFYRRKIFLRV